MPRNGQGQYSLPNPNFVAGQIIQSAIMNGDLSDIATALTDSICTDGQTPLTGPFLAPAGSALTPSYTFVANKTDGIFLLAGGGIGIAINEQLAASLTSAGLTTPTQGVTVPIGAVSDFGPASIPTGWLLCAGQAVSRVSFAALFAVIGTTYGIGDGSSTFNVPDCRGRATYGKDDMGGTAAGRISVAGQNFDGTILGNSGGLQNHSLQAAEVPSHTHTASVTDPTHNHTTNLGALGGGGTISVGVIGGANDPAGTGASVIANSTGITVTNQIAGSGNPYTTLNPSLITTKAIFAGA